MYTTENYLNAEIEYRAKRVRQTWTPRRRRAGEWDELPATRPQGGGHARTVR